MRWIAFAAMLSPAAAGTEWVPMLYDREGAAALAGRTDVCDADAPQSVTAKTETLHVTGADGPASAARCAP